MDKVIQIFNEIQMTRKINEKRRIIAENADNELFKTNLRFLLDDSIITGISLKKLQRKVYDGQESPIKDWVSCMDYVTQHNTGRDSDIYVVQAFIASQPPAQRIFYEAMITKTLRLGCDDKIVNSVIPNLIPKWTVMLGDARERLSLGKGEYFYLSQKMNGNRATWYHRRLLSRQGKEFRGMQHIINDIFTVGLENYFIDGELIRKNTDNLPDNENFRIGTGIINSDSEEKPDIELVIFDCFPAEWYVDGRSYEMYSDRKKRMKAIEKRIAKMKLENIRIVPMVYEGTDQTEIDKWLDKATELGWEGIMLNKEAQYVNQRTTNLIKIKRFNTMDLPIVGFVEGNGAMSGTLGAFIVKYKDNTVNVGAGITTDTRKEIWSHKEDYLGKIIEVKYKEITYSKQTGLESIQFPVFVCFRHDKEEESYV